MSGRSGAPNLEQMRKQGRQGEEEAQGHGGSFRLYMQHKNDKLQEQFAQLGEKQQSNLFAGVSIHVNGYTVPSQQVPQLAVRGLRLG